MDSSNQRGDRQVEQKESLSGTGTPNPLTMQPPPQKANADSSRRRFGSPASSLPPSLRVSLPRLLLCPGSW